MGTIVLLCFGAGPGAAVRQSEVINLTLIKPPVFIGTYPQNDVDLNRLQSGPKITAVLNLQTDDDFYALGIDWDKLEKSYTNRGMLCQRWPIVDFSPQDLEQRLETAASLVDQLVGVGHRVYIHCTAGVCRAPAAAIGYLAWYDGMGLEEAYELVKSLRSCDPYIDVIRSVDASRNASN